MPEFGRQSFTVMFAGGGSGGHLMPGLSVAQDLRRRYADACRIVFVGSTKALEPKLVTGYGFEFVALPSMKRPGELTDVPGWLSRCAGGLLGARRLVKKVKPDVVVSLGGYAALAPGFAAVLINVPLVVMEQNSIPGKVSKALSKWAEEVYVPWPKMEDQFARPERVFVTGNPIRDDLRCSRNRVRAQQFGLSPSKRTLLVMGGSQGSAFLNRAVLDTLPRLEAESQWLQILHSTGDGEHKDVLDAYKRSRIEAVALPFIEDMASAYAAADLALCRAGGTTLAELTALGLPGVLVPLPTAANNHQRKNASRVAGEGAAFIVDQNDIKPAQLAGILLNLLRNEACLSRARAASLRLGRPGATQAVAERLIKLLSVPVAPVMKVPQAVVAAEV
jgi:UDP-N-acetylglucosamine--N-acetylmuramyl-(pentapeptide) pyrophosphoryl-undecaprenol N-acetylglucosamine transferase